MVAGRQFCWRVVTCLWMSCVLFVAVGTNNAQAFFGKSADTIAVKDLPKEGRETLALIKNGGPFPYAKDGTIFGNREARLPKQKRGYYREYTVRTPGARNRGARRIVCGNAAECYYTADHYETFKLIKE
jgi:ribonuclease T1